MCPLRVVLIFLSAMLAGFFVLRNLKSEPQLSEADRSDDSVDRASGDPSESNKSSPYSKVRAAVGAGFWTCVDMASGRFLWRNLVSSSSSSKRST